MAHVLYYSESAYTPNAALIRSYRHKQTETLYAVEVKLYWPAFDDRVRVRCIVDAPTWLEADKAAREAATEKHLGEQPEVKSETIELRDNKGWPFPSAACHQSQDSLESPGLLRKPRIGEVLVSKRTLARFVATHFDANNENIVHVRDEKTGEATLFIWQLSDGLNRLFRHSGAR